MRYPDITRYSHTTRNTYGAEWYTVHAYDQKVHTQKNTNIYVNAKYSTTIYAHTRTQTTRTKQDKDIPYTHTKSNINIPGNEQIRWPFHDLPAGVEYPILTFACMISIMLPGQNRFEKPLANTLDQSYIRGPPFSIPRLGETRHRLLSSFKNGFNKYFVGAA